MAMVNKNKELALKYASWGWKIFPCNSKDRPYTENGEEKIFKTKAPHTKYGFNDASSSKKTINTWWDSLYKDAILGIFCVGSKFWGLYIDTDEETGRTGFDDLLEYGITKEMLDNAAASIQRTPSGGHHYLFTLPDFHIPNKKLLDNVDLRSDGYICSGVGGQYGDYVWIKGPEATQPPAPLELLELIKKHNFSPKKSSKSKSTSTSGSSKQDEETEGEHPQSPYNDAEEIYQWWLERTQEGNRNTNEYYMFWDMLDKKVDYPVAEIYAVRFSDDTGQEIEDVQRAFTRVYVDKYFTPSLSDLPYLNEKAPAVTVASSVEDDFVTTSASTIIAPKYNLPHRYSVDEILDEIYQEPRWAVPDILPEGLTLFGGRPKVGKSWFILQAGIAVASGGYFLGKKCEQGNVLYISYEDNKRRMDSRLRRLNITRGTPISIFLEWKPLQKGGLELLMYEIDTHDYRMVILDPYLYAFSGMAQDRNTEQVAKILNELQHYAINKPINITFVDHTRKNGNNYPDPIEDIMSTTYKTAAADAVLGLYSEQGRKGATLRGTGKEIDNIDMKLKWDFYAGCWQQNLTEVVAPVKDDIVEYLRKHPKSKASDVAKGIGGKDVSNTRTRLNTLVAEDKATCDPSVDNTNYYSLVEDVPFWVGS